jgi:hypothetical protein
VDVLGQSFKENLRHHPLVFVIEEMAVKDGHAPDYGVGEVHNDVDGTAVWNIHCVQPRRFGNWLAVFGVRQEMHLMNVQGMQFLCRIDNLPMLKRAAAAMAMAASIREMHARRDMEGFQAIVHSSLCQVESGS